MDLVYNFYSKPNNNRAELHFRFLLNKNDYVLLNQFPNEFFRASIEVGTGFLDVDNTIGLEELEGSTIAADAIKLGISWGQNTVEEVVHGDEIVWKSNRTYKLAFRNVNGGTQKLCKTFVEDISKSVRNTMSRLKGEVPNNDPSCYEAREKIEY